MTFFFPGLTVITAIFYTLHLTVLSIWNPSFSFSHFCLIGTSMIEEILSFYNMQVSVNPHFEITNTSRVYSSFVSWIVNTSTAFYLSLALWERQSQPILFEHCFHSEIIFCGHFEEALIIIFSCLWSKNAAAKCLVPMWRK